MHDEEFAPLRRLAAHDPSGSKDGAFAHSDQYWKASRIRLHLGHVGILVLRFSIVNRSVAPFPLFTNT
jgi:hypothetical protein